MAKVHVCPEPDCPELEPCPKHGHRRGRQRSNWGSRDQAQHMREARAAKRAHPYCAECGSVDKLDAHHQPDGSVIVLCNPCHVSVDSHARAR